MKMALAEKILFKSKSVINLPLLTRGVGAVCLIQILLLFPDYYEIFGKTGLSRSTLNAAFLSSFDLSIEKLANISGISDFIIVNALVALWAVLSVLLVKEGKGLTILFFTWLIHIVLINSSFLFSYGGDYMISFSLSFLLCATMLVRLGKYFPLHISQSEILSFATRMLQLFLCVVYFFGGLGKAIGLDWLTGDALWKVMVYFQYDLVRFTSPIISPVLWKILGWIFMFTELLYPAIVYNKFSNKYVIYLIILMHVWIGIFLNLYVFAEIMICLNIIAFTSLIPNAHDSTKKLGILA